MLLVVCIPLYQPNPYAVNMHILARMLLNIFYMCIIITHSFISAFNCKQKTSLSPPTDKQSTSLFQPDCGEYVSHLIISTPLFSVQTPTHCAPPLQPTPCLTQSPLCITLIKSKFHANHTHTHTHKHKNK